MESEEDARKGVRIRRMISADRDAVLRLLRRLEEAGMPTWRDTESMRAFHAELRAP